MIGLREENKLEHDNIETMKAEIDELKKYIKKNKGKRKDKEMPVIQEQDETDGTFITTGIDVEANYPRAEAKTRPGRASSITPRLKGNISLKNKQRRGTKV